MRRMIIGIAVGCYAAAVMIAAAAVRLPAPRNSAVGSQPGHAAAIPPPSPPEPGPTIADDTPTAPQPPSRSPVETNVSEEDALLRLAEQSQRAGDLKKTEAIYLLLLSKDDHRSAAAQKLGKLYFNAGDYARAEAMYRESARALRETNNTRPGP